MQLLRNYLSFGYHSLLLSNLLNFSLLYVRIFPNLLLIKDHLRHLDMVWRPPHRALSRYEEKVDILVADLEHTLRDIPIQGD